MSILLNLSSATLGAGFYTLFTTYKYISERTYEPAYNTINLLRFFLGIVSGVILANFGPNIGAKEYNPILLGVIGGYSSCTVIAFLTFIYQSTNLNISSVPYEEQGSQRSSPDAAQGTHKQVP